MFDLGDEKVTAYYVIMPFNLACQIGRSPAGTPAISRISHLALKLAMFPSYFAAFFRSAHTSDASAHFPACFSALTAGCCAIFHLLTQFFAGVGAGVANVSACSAYRRGIVRPPPHSASCHLASFDTVGHQTDVLWLKMLAAGFKAMIEQ